MRTPPDLAAPIPRGHHRARWWIVGLIVVIVVLLASLRSIATIYTDNLWFSSVGLHSVWSTLLAVKVGLFVCFGAAFFALMWTNLVVCDRIGTSGGVDVDDELVRRYQKAIHPYAGRIYAVLALVLALIAAAGTIGEWQNWILFTHGGSFASTDPQFHMNAGFYVFKLPFLQFVVNWLLISLVVVLAITAVFHYLNGGIRTHQATPRVQPAVRAHLSVLLAALAIVKAGGYLLQRYQLVTSTNGYVEGAGYADVHYRIPALELLFWVCLAAAAVLLWNARRRTWLLPSLAVGGWAFVALGAGVIYPAVQQALTVNPAQLSLERPYIERNIAATRAAYGLQHVKTTQISGSSNISSAEATASLPSLQNVRVWDPSSQISLPTFQKTQDIFSYYTFTTVGVDRYKVNGKETPVVVGVRQIDPSQLPSGSWVTTHLEYTHGLGMVVAAANTATSDGEPQFLIKNVPPTSSGLPQVSQPDVYFGLDQPGYVVADTRTSELEEQLAGSVKTTDHYKGTGGVRLGSFLTRAAFAIREGDVNLLVSDQITTSSRIMFVRDVRQMAEKAAPFLSFDSHPYPVLVNGQIDWVLNGYTTTDQYPYSQNANTALVPSGSGLPQSYNYVRDSVTVVVNAYSGSMKFYAMDNNDPILRAYESAFPHLFTSASEMSPALRAHLRYPQDYFSIQAAMYGRYHLTSVDAFSLPGNAWALSPTAGVGSPSQALVVTQTTNSRGQTVSGPLERMAPQYELVQAPGQSTQSFSVVDAFVPASRGSPAQNLSAYMMGSSGPNGYGQLRAYVTPVGHEVIGPAQADAEIEQKTPVSQAISLLDQRGSSVILGNLLMVPVGQSVIYVRPLYVESTGNPAPELRDVIAVRGTDVEMGSTLNEALSAVLPISVGGVSTPTGASQAPLANATAQQIQQYLQEASADYLKAEQALKNEGASGFATYEADIQQMYVALGQAQKLLAASGVGTSGSKSSPNGSSTNGSSSTSGSGSATSSAIPSSSGSSTTTSTTAAGSAPSNGTAGPSLGRSSTSVASTQQQSASGLGTPSGTTTTSGSSSQQAAGSPPPSKT